jgi:Ca2+-binding RTX toxin-like protein
VFGQGFPCLRTCRLVGVAALVLACMALFAATASATVTCSYNGEAGTYTITVGTPNDGAFISQNGGNIVVDRTAEPDCTGEATLANTDFINIVDAQPESGVGIVGAPEFAATTKFIAAITGPDATLAFLGTIAGTPVHTFVGEKGVDTDGNGSVDVTFAGEPDHVNIQASPQADVINFQGSLKTGKAFAGDTRMLGQAGNDLLIGGEGRDEIFGEGGDDELFGMGGNDGMVGDGSEDQGSDLIDGGEGEDLIGFSRGPVRVDLAAGGPQDTGQGKDRIVSVEDVNGTQEDDVLLGNEAANRIVGFDGDDTIDGRGGKDSLDGQAGDDTLSYADAPAAVQVDLGESKATGGFGEDLVFDFENLVGSRFDDRLVGSDEPNRIDPGAGRDLVQALGGDDTILARDGAGDDVSCGAGRDGALADRRSLDTIRPDCELVDALPEPAAPGAGGGGGAPPAGGGPKKTLLLKLGGAKTQRLVAKRALVVKVRCPQEACTATATASGRLAAVGSEPKRTLKLKKVTKKLAAGEAKKLTLHLGRKQAAAIGARLDAGKRVALQVSVSATGADGAGTLAKFNVVARQ